MITHSNYKNKYFSILGDSISTLEGYSIPECAAFYDTHHKILSEVLVPSDTWWGRVIEAACGELLINNSISGSTVCWDNLYEIPSYGCSAERTAGLSKGNLLPDVIMIFMGMNDWGRAVKVLPDEGEESDLSVFFVAYRQMLRQLKNNYPKAELWCFTLPVSTCTRIENFVFPYCYGGIHIEEYCDVIRDCAKQSGALLIDLYNDAMVYDTLDGFHPTASGMKTLSDAVIEQLKNV